MKPRTWGVGAVVPVRRMDPPVYALPEGLESGAQVRVMSISPGYCRVKLAGGSDGREWTVAWPLLEGWTARSLRVNPPKRGGEVGK